MITVDVGYPAVLNTSVEGDTQDRSKSYADEPTLPDDQIISYHGIWISLFDNLNQCDRSIREQFRGYRRIFADNILQHETRQKIFQIVCDNPGISLSQLAELSKVNESTLRYHVARIEKERCITAYESGKSHHFFENHHKYSREEKELYSRYSSGLSGRILRQVSECPGITRRELADRLGVTSPTVTRAVRNLYNDGFLILVREGKFTRHYLSHSEGNMMKDHPCLHQDN
jgi:DNA-binding MarR family transcriptional regulator